MKKEWVRPLTTVQVFAANEYIASSCGDENKVYKFKCNAPRGTLYYYRNSDGDIDGEYNGTSGATKLGGYKPCGKEEETPFKTEFYDGFIDLNNNKRYDDGEGVIVYIESAPFLGIYNWHATGNLDMQSWETAKS